MTGGVRLLQAVIAAGEEGGGLGPTEVALLAVGIRAAIRDASIDLEVGLGLEAGWRQAIRDHLAARSVRGLGGGASTRSSARAFSEAVERYFSSGGFQRDCRDGRRPKGERSRYFDAIHAAGGHPPSESSLRRWIAADTGSNTPLHLSQSNRQAALEGKGNDQT